MEISKIIAHRINTISQLKSVPKILFPEIDLSAVKGVMIDLDNTLYLYEPCHNFALKSCYEKFFTKKFSFDDFAALYKKHRDEVTVSLDAQGACRSRLFAFQHLLEEMQEQESYVKALMLDQLYWGHFISAMQLEEDAKNFLEICKAKFLSVCVVTDMLAETQIKKLQKLQITEYVNYLVTSEEVGQEKPNALIFEVALKKMNLQKQQVIMIGDDLKKDVEGAKDNGIQSYQIKIHHG